jgi:hypothetical protein
MSFRLFSDHISKFNCAVLQKKSVATETIDEEIKMAQMICSLDNKEECISCSG